MSTSKSVIFIGLLALLASATQSCRRPPESTSLNYEVKALEQGKQGTVMFKVFSYGNTARQAIDRAKMDAMHAVLFKGIPGSNSVRPLVDLATLESNKKYFVDFFGGANEINQYSLGYIKIKEGSHEGPYRLYISESSDGSITDRLSVNNMVKVGLPVVVNLDELRRKLEQDGIIRKFGL